MLVPEDYDYFNKLTNPGDIYAVYYYRLKGCRPLTQHEIDMLNKYISWCDEPYSGDKDENNS